MLIGYITPRGNNQHTQYVSLYKSKKVGKIASEMYFIIAREYINNICFKIPTVCVDFDTAKHYFEVDIAIKWESLHYILVANK
jgi:hypothetical protein